MEPPEEFQEANESEQDMVDAREAQPASAQEEDREIDQEEGDALGQFASAEKSAETSPTRTPPGPPGSADKLDPLDSSEPMQLTNQGGVREKENEQDPVAEQARNDADTQPSPPPSVPSPVKQEPTPSTEHDKQEDEPPQPPLNDPPPKDNVESKETEPPQPTGLSLGGTIAAHAFCLLDGIYQTPDDPQNSKHRVTIPLTRLPAVLGRAHTTDDRNFFSLGRGKALSRQHCVIEYRDSTGGKLVSPEVIGGKKKPKADPKLDYEPGTPFSFLPPDNHNLNTSQEGGHEEQSDTSPKYPKEGSFVLEVLGKNPVLVGKQRVGPGDVALLTQGTPIRMSTYSLYFMLPTDAPATSNIMKIPVTSTSLPEKATSQPAETMKKRKMPSPNDMPQPKVKKTKAAPFAQLQAELDTLDIDTLMERMTEACQGEKWERKHQLIGSTISLHAVREATASPRIRELAKDGGVGRTEIMKWIAESPKYAYWVEQMMSKMEAKSYQNTITKSLLKAGNVRTGSGGRYIKWILPGVELNTGTGPNKEEESEGKGDGDDGEDGDEEEDEEGGGGDDDQEEENDDNAANSDGGDDE